MKEAVACSIPAAFVAEVGRGVEREAGNCRKTKDGLKVKAVDCCSAELDSIPASTTEFQCNGQIT